MCLCFAAVLSIRCFKITASHVEMPFILVGLIAYYLE